MPAEVIVFVSAVGIGFLYAFLKPAIEERIHVRRYGKELEDPFTAEVILAGEIVAHLSDREITEMFWREYLIEPRSAEAKKIIEDDDLWEKCAFNYRDPKTGRICTTGFAGGARPFVRNGKISLRALYFGRTANPPSPSGEAICNT